MYNYISYVVAHTKRTGPGRIEGVAHYILFYSHHIMYILYIILPRARQAHRAGGRVEGVGEEGGLDHEGGVGDALVEQVDAEEGRLVGRRAEDVQKLGGADY